MLAKIPKGMSFAEAASHPPRRPHSGPKRLQRRRPSYRAPKVLILAGSGGVGSFAIQYASKVLGLEVWTTSASEELCKELGAAHVINYKKQAVEDVIARGQMDMVVDCLGGPGCADHVLQLGAAWGPCGRYFQRRVGPQRCWAKRASCSSR